MASTLGSAGAWVEGGSGSAIGLNDGYFAVKILAAQAAYRGVIWDRAPQVAVTSTVSLVGGGFDGVEAKSVHWVSHSNPVRLSGWGYRGASLVSYPRSLGS